MKPSQIFTRNRLRAEVAGAAPLAAHHRSALSRARFFVPLFSLLLVAASQPILAQPAMFWENTASLIYPPDLEALKQIDAINVINDRTAVINITYVDPISGALDSLPYFQTSDTLNFTNHGLITINSSCKFDTEPANMGYAHWASSFYNDGVINSGLGLSSFFLVSGVPRTIVQATNIVNPGTLLNGFEGLISLEGGIINLDRGVVALETNGTSLSDLSGNGFVDGFWASSTNVINPSAQFSGPIAFTPGDTLVTDRNYNTLIEQLPGTIGYLDDTGAVNSNRVVRVVYVNNTNAAFNINVYFPTFPIIGDIEVAFLSSTTNLFLYDDFGVVTNKSLVQNGFAGALATFIPINYTFFPFDFHTTPPAQSTAIPASTFISRVVTNEYIAYQAKFLPTTRVVSDVVGQDLTNIPGRIVITATNSLDLTLAQIICNNYLFLNATNDFVGNDGAIISSPFVDMNLRGARGSLTISKLLVPSVPRPEGDINLYSARWTNIVAGITNKFHVLFVDCELSPTFPTRVENLTLKTPLLTNGNSITVRDVLIVSRTLDIETTSLTIATNEPGSPTPNGGIFLESDAITWSTAAPNLQFFTNNGFFSAPNSVFFGGSRSSPYLGVPASDTNYAEFVNTGGVTNFSSQIWATDFQNYGTFLALGGGIRLQQNRTATLRDGQFLAPGGDISIGSGRLIVSNHVMTAGGAISLSVTNLLDDGSLGCGSADNVTNKNSWQAGGSFNLLVRPGAASLLATTVSNTVPPYARGVSVWAGANEGCSPSGFLNNAGLGRLFLNGGLNSLYEFAGAGGNNAIYVDYLELDGFTATNHDNAGNWTGVQIDPGMKIYYGQAFDGADGLDISYKLSGRNGGAFCWVSNYNCGFYSSSLIIYRDGTTNRVNTALAQSCDIASDTNGCVNCNWASCSTQNGPIPTYLLASCGCVTNSGANLASLENGVASGGAGTPGGAPTLTVPVIPGLESSAVPTNGFAIAKGTYNGLFYDPSGVAVASSGFFTASTTATRTYSGHLTLGGRAYSISGRFDGAGRATNVVIITKQNVLTVRMQLDLNGGDQIRGSVSGSNWIASLLADRVVYNAAAHNPAPQAGAYTVALPGNGGQGDSVASVKVDKNGNATWSGYLADGTAISPVGTISKQGLSPLYVSLYGGIGELIGWVQFATNAPGDVGGQTIWIKPCSKSAYYPAGMTNAVGLVGSAYQTAASVPLALGTNSLYFTLSGGGLSGPIIAGVTVGPGNTVTGVPWSKLNLSLTLATGRFSGTMLNPHIGKTVSFQGVLIKPGGQSQFGAGYFLNPGQNGQNGQSGEVLLSPTY